MQTFTAKRKGMGLQMKTVAGDSATYLFLKTPAGKFHVLVEVEAKEAACDCGATSQSDTQSMCKEVWNAH